MTGPMTDERLAKLRDLADEWKQYGEDRLSGVRECLDEIERLKSENKAERQKLDEAVQLPTLP